MVSPPYLVLITVRMVPPSKRVAVIVNMLIPLSCVAVTVKKVDPPKCVAATEEGPPHAAADTGIVLRVLRNPIVGRDPGRCSGTTGAMGTPETEKIRKNDF